MGPFLPRWAISPSLQNCALHVNGARVLVKVAEQPPHLHACIRLPHAFTRCPVKVPQFESASRRDSLSAWALHEAARAVTHYITHAAVYRCVMMRECHSCCAVWYGALCWFRWLYENSLSGTLPSSLGNLTELTLMCGLGLEVGECSGGHCNRMWPWKSCMTTLFFSVHLPTLSMCCRSLEKNWLVGAIPAKLGHCTKLQQL